jgi:hypothetical protein
MLNRYLFFFFFFFLSSLCFGQDIFSGSSILDEFQRRENFNNPSENHLSQMLRFNYGLSRKIFYKEDILDSSKSSIIIEGSPLLSTIRYDFNRPFDFGEYGIIPSKGFQSFLSSGFKLKFHSLNFQFQPEFVFAENKSFKGFPSFYPSNVVSSRFFSWNIGDNPERFGDSMYMKFFLGQSNLSYRFGVFEIGAGTRNYWWGPGQWNSLIFSNNAPGFPNVSLNTHKQAKTLLGNFEGQLLVGRLESSGFGSSQSDSLNNKFFIPLNSDWRYLNGLLIIYNPKWIPMLNFGFARTFQYYNESRPKDFFGWFPVFEPMTKKNLFKNGNSIVYDDRAQSQQISIFTNFKFLDSKAEIYFQFGRRDHSFSWREFILNPEHARAYQFGFLKLKDLPLSKKQLQIRGEITHQQESVNRNLRYDQYGFYSWHTHGIVRGFTNYGQPMGVGIGTGSNVQTLEVAIVESWNKFGILFERLENNQDFYYRSFGQQGERKPWIDWSTAFLLNTTYKHLVISARLQGTYSRNYQWGISENSSPEFPVSQNMFSLHSQVNLIYFWNRGVDKNLNN